MVELSIIIPTYNRVALLRRCLDALRGLTLPVTEFEVIVVVDGSTDGTAQLLTGYDASFPLRTQVQQNAGVAAARNRGLDLAAGRYCLFLDDDVVASPNLATEHLRVQRERGGVVGLGHLTCDLGADADDFSRSVAAWWDEHYARLRNGRRTASFIDCFSGNLSAPRAALRAVGGFATDLPHSEDVELGYRLERHGLVTAYIPEAVASQEYRKGSSAIIADATAEGIASVELYRRHPPILSELLLGKFAAAPPRVVALRRLCLALAVPLGFLRLLSPLVGRGRRMRSWYSFVYDYAYWRAVRRTVPDREAWRRLTRGVVILMYHAFATRGETASRYVTPARTFARQMQWLKRRGYRVLPLDELLRLRRESRLPPAGTIVITMDDGYADVHAVAYPILERHGFPATVFLVSSAVGTRNSWDGDGALGGRTLLDWPAIHAMRAGGIAYGAHSRSHRALTEVPAHELDDEVTGCRTDLETALGESVAAFSYPYGTVDARTAAAVEHAGFHGACGVRYGVNTVATPSYALHRTEVFGTDSLLRFALAVSFGDPLRQLGRRASQ